jgi:predicted nucleotidyltransferase
MEKEMEKRELIDQITERIKSEYQPEKIILFGSYVYGTPSETSDIDLFIVKETEKSRRERFCEVRKILRDIRGVSIQPIVFTRAELEYRIRLKDDFILEILEKGELLYG